jgi:hypothetical protein
MAVIASDGFSGIGTAGLKDRAFDNASGGSASVTWGGTYSNDFFGNNANAVVAGNASAIALAESASARKARIKVDPSGGSSNMALWAMRDNDAWNAGNGMLLLLVGDFTSLRASSISAGSRTDHQSLTITAPSGVFWMEVEVDTSAKTLTCRILNSDTSVRNTVTHTFTTLPSGGNFWGPGMYQNGNTGVFDDFILDDGVSGDVTAPTLTSATATATSATTATGGVTTDEAGPAWAVLTTSSTTPSAAQIKAGQNHTGAAASASATATLTVGVNSSVFAFTGLTGGGTYWEHVVQDDTATPANTSTPITSASSITTPTPDTTNPTWPGGTTLGASNKTDTTVTLTASADATDNVAVAGYEWSSDDGASYPFTSLTKTFQFTALTALTSYPFKSRAYDAAGNKSAAISLTTSTYRAGDTAANILANTGPVGGNPAGFLYAFASTVSGTDWLSYTITSGPTPSGGTLTANPDGTFTYVGPDAATMVIQPEVNGVNAAETITVTLYDQSPDTELPVLTGSITVTNLTSTSYDMECPAGTDNVGVTGYEYSLNGGSSWTNNGNDRTASAAGRTPESTDSVRWRCYDAAGNRSNELSVSVTLLAGPDVTKPLLSDPTAYASGPTTASGTVTTNEATGTLYFLRNNSATATDVAVEAGLSQSVTAAGIQTVNVTGLTASTPSNYIHYLHIDAAGNRSLVSSSAAFTTPAEPPPGVVSDEVGFRSCMRYPMESAIKGALA